MDACARCRTHIQDDYVFCPQCGIRIGYSRLEKHVPIHPSVLALQNEARDGDIAAMYALGACYENGDGITMNKAEAFQWYSKAASEGQIQAQISLGICLIYGDGTKPNEQEGFKWIAKAAKQKDAWGQYCLARCYLYGIGTMQNENKAFNLFKKSARQGHTWAQNALGTCYQLGIGKQTDDKEGAKWYRQAALNKNMWGAYNWGECLTDGIGTRKDEDEAINAWRQAAQQGLACAQARLEKRYLTARKPAKHGAEAQHTLDKLHQKGTWTAKEEENSLPLTSFYCPICNNKVDQGFKFCDQCGGALSPASLLQEHQIPQPSQILSSREILERARLQDPASPSASPEPPVPRSAANRYRRQ